ncbi:glycosyltransferase family 2 protein [Novosphingobium resinovorum]|uniref:glycosyltransferase family 2 protein n=1 Tax=Novosphingobium resinovorum TaxID=158500 RepID=UPI002ED3D2BD|nr:glycosyltransferase family 2 protein [Novosphingobium resinovorum]
MADAWDDTDVLIVVPCLNEEEHLSALLTDLLADARGALIVVADGGSEDRSPQLVEALAARHSNLVLLDNPKRIQSAGVNLAARRYGAGRRWLVRIDAHAGYPVRFVERLRLAAGGMRATSVVVPMVTRGSACFQKAAAAAQNSVLGTGGAPHRHLGPGRWVDHGHHALFDLELFMAVGGYDENFAANEDAELDRRLLAAGGRIWLEPLAAITYYPRSSMAALFRQYRNYGKGRARNLRRHPAPVKLRQALPLAVAPAIAAGLSGIAFSAWNGAALLLALPMACWLAVSLVFGALLGYRSGCRCDAAAGVAAIIMHAGWSLGFLSEALDQRRPQEAPGPLRFEPADGAVQDRTMFVA